MSPFAIILAIALGWTVLVLLIRALIVRPLRHGPGGDPITGLLWRSIQIYALLVHRTIWRGLERVPQTIRPGPLIVVSNHTSSIDPILIQAACRFEIRWMMAREMMSPTLDWLWRRHRIIPVDRSGGDPSALREAIRHVRGGGVLGVFPEGRLVRPHGVVWPFHPGVGLVIARTRAPVLLVFISGTPETTDMAGALRTPSRARLRFIDRIEFSGEEEPAEIAAELRRRLAEASGWEMCDDVPPLRAGECDPFVPR